MPKWCLDKATHHIIFSTQYSHCISTLLANWMSFKDKEQEIEQENVQGVFYDGFMLDLCQIFYVKLGDYWGSQV